MRKLDILLLRIRDRVTMREFITATANAELHKVGQWQVNWEAVNQEISQDLIDLWREVELLKEPPCAS